MPGAPFRPGYEATVAKAFTFAGTKYATGERFPYRDLGVIDFDLRGLWMAELVSFGDELYRVTDAELDRLTAPRAPAPPAKHAAKR